MNNEPHNSIQNEVLAKIARGDVRMHPRVYFLLRAGAAALLSIVVLALSVFVLSFILFSVHESGEQFLLGFGTQGIAVFFNLFPWIPLLIDIVLIMALEWLLQSFSIGYRLSFVTLFGSIVAIAGVLSILVYFTPLHQTFLDRADHGQLPIGGEFYERIHDSHEDRGVFRGTVTSMSTSSFALNCDDGDKDKDEGSFNVLVSPTTPFNQFSIGDRVYVFGTTTHPGIIEAWGVQKLER